MSPPQTIGPQFSGDLFLQDNNRHTSARAQKLFPIRNMRPLSIREPPRTGGRGVRLSTGSVEEKGAEEVFKVKGQGHSATKAWYP